MTFNFWSQFVSINLCHTFWEKAPSLALWRKLLEGLVMEEVVDQPSWIAI